MTRMKGRKNSFGWLWALLGAIFIVVAIIAIIIFLLHGDISVSNPDREVDATSSLSCESDGIVYPFIADNAGKKTMKINAVFAENKLNTVSLTYQQDYASSEQIKQAVTDGSIAMNRNFQQDGLARDSLGMKFSALTNMLQMSLFTDSKSINGATAKYFLLDAITGNYTRDNLKNAYEQLGMNCTTKE